jgi:hypothetical protein
MLTRLRLHVENCVENIAHRNRKELFYFFTEKKYQEQTEIAQNNTENKNSVECKSGG